MVSGVIGHGRGGIYLPRYSTQLILVPSSTPSADNGTSSNNVRRTKGPSLREIALELPDAEEVWSYGSSDAMLNQSCYHECRNAIVELMRRSSRGAKGSFCWEYDAAGKLRSWAGNLMTWSSGVGTSP